MTGHLERTLAAIILVGACSHGASAPAPAAVPVAAPGPGAVMPFSPADNRRTGAGAPTPVTATEAAAAAAPQAAEPPLYLRLGGQGAIAMVVDTFTARVHGDTALAPLFRGTDMDMFKRMMNELLCEATGGGCQYTGRSMRASHTGLNVTDAQFDTVVGYLSATLDQFNVPVREKNELLGLLAPMRGDIVGH
jgi:hemoglobin